MPRLPKIEQCPPLLGRWLRRRDSALTPLTAGLLVACAETSRRTPEQPPTDPVFLEPPSNLVITENQSGVTNPIPVGPPIQANDVNADPITYRLKNADADSRFNGFEIDPTTGQIRYASTGLDYEAAPRIEIIVTASSTGVNGRIVTIEQRIIVSVVNDPSDDFFDAVFTTVPADLQISENASGLSVPVLVGSVTATDENGDPVTYSLLGADVNGHVNGFEIDTATGQIRYVGPGLDHESATSVTLTVIATSLGANGEPTSVEQELTIAVANDPSDDRFDAVFNPVTDDLEIAENLGNQSGPVGSPVIATDADGDVIAYSLKDADANGQINGFAIDSATGQIRFAGTGLDFIVEPRIPLTVVATSIGANGNPTMVEQEVEVVILPSAPVTSYVFDGPVQGAKLYIDLNRNGVIDAGDSLIGVTGSDGSVQVPGRYAGLEFIADLGGAVDIYTTEQFAAGRLYKAISDANSGTLVLSPISTAIRELIATDNGIDDATTALMTMFGMDTALTPENIQDPDHYELPDSAAVDLSPVQQEILERTIQLGALQDMLAGDALVQALEDGLVPGEDLPGVDLAALEMRLRTSAADRASGTPFVNPAADLEMMEDTQLNLPTAAWGFQDPVGTDRGLQSIDIMGLVMTDSEGMNVTGALLLSGANDEVTDFPASVAPGQLSTLRFAPPQDSFGIVRITYRGTDRDGQQSDEQTLEIEVKPVNDAPVLTTFGAGSIREDAAADTPTNVRFRVADADADIITRDDFTVTETSGLPSQRFGVMAGTQAGEFLLVLLSGGAVDADDGVLSIPLQVRVSDGTVDSNPLNVTIDVTPVNEAPVLTLASGASGSITEGAPANALTGIRFVVTDEDRNDADFITDDFTVTETGGAVSAQFKVIEVAGLFYLAVRSGQTIDAEDGTTSIALQVRVNGRDAEEADSNVLDVTVAIVDVDDNAVAFSATSYTAALEENLSGASTPVNLVVVAASDDDRDAIITGYELVAATDDVSNDATALFQVTNTGQVQYVGTGLDAESGPDEYSLTVRAISSDGGSADVTVTVTVADVSESPPPAASATALSESVLGGRAVDVSLPPASFGMGAAKAAYGDLDPGDKIDLGAITALDANGGMDGGQEYMYVVGAFPATVNGLWQPDWPLATVDFPHFDAPVVDLSGYSDGTFLCADCTV